MQVAACQYQRRTRRARLGQYAEFLFSAPIPPLRDTGQSLTTQLQSAPEHSLNDHALRHQIPTVLSDQWASSGATLPETTIIGATPGCISAGDMAPGNYVSLASLTEAAISAIDRNSTSPSSFDGKNPRRRQNAAASSSTALTISARPPISAAPFTLRASA